MTTELEKLADEIDAMSLQDRLRMSAAFIDKGLLGIAHAIGNKAVLELSILKHQHEAQKRKQAVPK
ncbi:MAG: hypothetical protein WC455_18470 [Dehalococcoidia bacterium]|jgi:hypothetical protein